MKIASLSPAATEILFALGLGHLIVCTDQFSNFPEETKKVPYLKDHQRINAAALSEFKPDVVLTGTVIQEKLAEQLKAEGFTVVHQDPHFLADVFETIAQLETLFSQWADQADVLIARLRAELHVLEKRAKLMGARPKVYIEEWHDPPMVSGNWVPELIRAAGGQSFPIEAGALSRAVTLDEVKKFDPDLIVISWCGAGLLADKSLLMKREGWDQLRAVRLDHVRVIDDSLLNRPGPRLVEGAKRVYGWMFELLH